MQVTFKNTGMVESADIRFDGLTVIAGKNDTGKSTVGKFMFSLLKTFNRYETDARLYRVRLADKVIDDFYFDFREKNNDPVEVQLAQAFCDRTKEDILALAEVDETDKKKIEAAVAKNVYSFAQAVLAYSGLQPDSHDIITRIVKSIRKKPRKQDVFADTFNKYTYSSFGPDIVNTFSDTDGYSITGKDGEIEIFNIVSKNNGLTIDLKDKLYFKDATFIESPILMNLVDNIRFSNSYLDIDGPIEKKVRSLDKAYSPEYMKDFIRKLTQPVAPKMKSKEKDAAGDHIKRIISGHFYYDPRERNFVFEKKGKSFKGLTIATGIKSIGAIGLLLQTGFLEENSLLIIDEPETHIHPEWQLHLAELLVNLVKAGRHVLVTSHSPYFLEALKVFSDKLPGKEKTAFYLSERNGDGCTSRILDVTTDVSPIFDLLAEPYDRLEALQ